MSTKNDIHWYPDEKSEKGFPYSSLVDKIERKGNRLFFRINTPVENMQTDAANFESIALMCRCVEPKCEVEIDFALSGWKETIGGKKTVSAGWDGRFGKKTKKCNIYTRLLYRADAFRRAYDWVHFSKSAEAEIDRFVDLLGHSTPSNNIPKQTAAFNESKGLEHIIENKLTHTQKGMQYLYEIYYAKTRAHLWVAQNQLPNGLFNIGLSQKPSNDNRIFTTGFYDIWSIDNEGVFSVFELKEPGNNKLGIISELFFYAVYAHEVLINKNRLHQKGRKKNYRGYGDLYETVKEDRIKSVRAFFFLAENSGHTSIKLHQTRLLEELNNNRLGIHFDFLYYDPRIIEKISTNEIKIKQADK